MKVLIAIIFAIGSVSALGSGPYLPSGWRPKGPSFLLPSEVEKPVKLSESPLKETLLDSETEASGSDALREYGPPKLEVVAVIGNQGLPDVVTEQAFYVEAKAEQQSQVLADVDTAFSVQGNTEQVAAVVEAATEAQLAAVAVEQQNTESLTEVQPTIEAKSEEVVAEIVDGTSEPILEGDLEAVVPTAAVEEVVVPTAVAAEEVVPTASVQEEIVPTDVTQEVVSTVASQEETIAPTVAVEEEAVVPTVAAEQEIVVPIAAGPEVAVVVQEEVVVPTAGVQEEVVVAVVVPQEDVPLVEEVIVGKAVEGVNNVNEALANLEKEVKAAEILEGVVEINQEVSGTLEQAPEGFLEYGPPGFREYGPPKDDVARSAAVEVAPTSAFENNEVRRRRYSPKFRSQKKH